MNLPDQLRVLIVHFASAVLPAVLFTAARAQPLPRQVMATGEIIEKVICAESPEQSYALYLPSKYTAEKSWPLLLALDPGARGKIPVEHFKEAAEKYGWIVVASNNSRNGPIAPSVRAIDALWRDTHVRFSIDDRRVYFTGFSGAARAVIAIAGACNQCAAGVITGGAGFPPTFAPSKATRFSFFTTIGIDDFNFPEVKQFEDTLAKAGVDHQVRVFDGKHEWAPADVLVEALEWMELRAMSVGARAREDKLIDDLWRKQLTRAQALESAGDRYQAYQAYLAAASSFNSLRDVTLIKERVAALGGSREIRDGRRSEEQEIRKQRDLEKQIYGLLTRSGTDSLFADNDRHGAAGGPGEEASPVRPGSVGDLSSDDRASAQSKLRAMIVDVRKASVSINDPSERRVARRVLGGLYIALVERGSNFLEVQKRYRPAVRMFELATEVSPERSGIYYLLATAYAANGDKKKSLNALKTAFEKGFKDLEAVKKNAAFDSIRSEPGYQDLVKKLSSPPS